MVLQGLQVLGFSLGVLALAGVITTCAYPEWKKNTQGQPVIAGTSLSYEGLWLRCSVYVAGQTHCEGFKAFYAGLQDVLQVCRGLIIAAIVLGFVAVFVTVMGLKCVTMGGKNTILKARVAMTGGLMFGVTGIFTGAAVSYYAHKVVQEYYNPVQPMEQPLQLRFEYGHALFIGWATLVLGLLSAILLTAISVSITAGAREQEHVATDSANVHDQHSYRPVTILQRVDQQNEAIPMHTINTTSSQPIPPQRQVRIHRIAKQEELNGSNRYTSNSAASSSDRRTREYDRRRQTDRSRLSSERSSKSRQQHDREAAERPKTRKRDLHLQELPPSGLVRSVSGSLKQYL